MDKEFREKFKIKEKKKEFKTHKDLDIFVTNLINIVPAFQVKYPLEYQFLVRFNFLIKIRNQLIVHFG